MKIERQINKLMIEKIKNLRIKAILNKVLIYFISKKYVKKFVFILFNYILH